jgi:hypothetical protein
MNQCTNWEVVLSMRSLRQLRDATIEEQLQAVFSITLTYHPGLVE